MQLEPKAWLVISEPRQTWHFARTKEDAERISDNLLKYAARCTSTTIEPLYLQAAQPVPVVTTITAATIEKACTDPIEIWPTGWRETYPALASPNVGTVKARLLAALTATASAEPVAWQPIETAPKNETWIILFGDLYGEPHGHVGFWSEDDADWFDSEAASKSLTAFGWKPTHWCPFDDPLPAQGGKADE